MIEKVLGYAIACAWTGLVTLFFAPAPLPVSAIDLARAAAYCRGSAVLSVESELRMLRRRRTVACFDGQAFDMDRDEPPSPYRRSSR
jgi:hypothetical protein